VLYNHAIRYEWLTFNPISRVRTSQKRLRDKDVLMPEEFQRLVQQLNVRDRAMVLLILGGHPKAAIRYHLKTGHRE